MWLLFSELTISSVITNDQIKNKQNKECFPSFGHSNLAYQAYASQFSLFITVILFLTSLEVFAQSNCRSQILKCRVAIKDFKTLPTDKQFNRIRKAASPLNITELFSPCNSISRASTSKNSTVTILTELTRPATSTEFTFRTTTITNKTKAAGLIFLPNLATSMPWNV